MIAADGPAEFLRIAWKPIVRRHEVHIRVNGVNCGVEAVERPTYAVPIAPGCIYEARVRAVRATPDGPAPGDWTPWARYVPRVRKADRKTSETPEGDAA